MATTLNVFCTICAEQFGSAENTLSTACGHVFHSHCYENWNQRNQTCPECRTAQPVTRRIYLNLMNNSSADDTEPSTSQYNLVKRISLLERKLEENEKNLYDAQLALSAAEKCVDDLNDMLEIKKARLESYNQKLENMQLVLEDSEVNLLNSLCELAKTESTLQLSKKVSKAAIAENVLVEIVEN